MFDRGSIIEELDGNDDPQDLLSQMSVGYYDGVGVNGCPYLCTEVGKIGGWVWCCQHSLALTHYNGQMELDNLTKHLVSQI